MDRWAASCNETLSRAELPISVAAYRNMWTVRYHQPSAYQFLFHGESRIGFQARHGLQSKLAASHQTQQGSPSEATGVQLVGSRHGWFLA